MIKHMFLWRTCVLIRARRNNAMHILDSVYFKHNIKLPKLHYRAKAGCLDSYNHLCLLKQRLQCLMFVRQ